MPPNIDSSAIVMTFYKLVEDRWFEKLTTKIFENQIFKPPQKSKVRKTSMNEFVETNVKEIKNSGWSSLLRITSRITSQKILWHCTCDLQIWKCSYFLIIIEIFEILAAYRLVYILTQSVQMRF